ncbi:MAG: type I polyketide synthase [Desulfamplus sp.]|nr:type I polyketide synthase [Desulfamplus sp.]
MSDNNQKINVGYESKSASETSQRLEQLTPLQRALFGLKEMRKKYDELRQERNEPIAIIGMGCRFPGGDKDIYNLSDYWNLLKNRRSGVVEVPIERWDNSIYYDSDQDASGRISTKFAAMLNSIDTFDAPFFRITPIEAKSMDPQQRLLLEVAWEALENANIAPHTLAKSRTGVFVGIMGLDYGANVMGSGQPEDIDAYFGTGNTLGLAAGRLSYFFKLNGPSFSLDTACSSSLVALHLASKSLRDRESNMAIVGGVNLIMAPEVSISFSKAHLMAPDGRSKTFDAEADGYVRGEGCGVVCLKRLSQAIKDGDHIWALIRGSAVNHDGPSGGLTVPSAPAQEAVIRQALNMAGLKPEDIDYIEAHGTGTSLGDPIEVGALSRIFKNPRNEPLLVGSIKTNIGHLEAAAGMASLCKVVLGLQNEMIPAQLYFNTPNPKINWASIPIKVASDHVQWSKGEKIRFAGLSGFSFGGTNAHIIVSEPPTEKVPNEIDINIDKETVEDKYGDKSTVKEIHIVPISARSKNALKELSNRYLQLLDNSLRNDESDSKPVPKFKDISYTAATCRTHFEHRIALVAQNSQDATRLLQLADEDSADQDIFYGKVSKSPRKVFLYTGQGSQYPNMGLEFYETQPVFREAMDRCFDFIDQSGLSERLPKPLREVMFLPKSLSNENKIDSPPQSKPMNIFPFKPRIGTTDLDNTLYTQPAMFILQFALTELWKSWGVFPEAVMGHSLGEYAAACSAGVFSHEDGLKLIIERAHLMSKISDQGKMVSVFAPLEVVESVVEPFNDKVSIAAINGPEIVLISGFATAIDKVIKELAARRLRAVQVNISTAFHSPLTEKIMEDFRLTAQTISYQSPIVPVISNLTGEPIGDEICSVDYWCQHMRQPVQFVKSLLYIRKSYDTLIEIGPAPNLIDLDMTLPEDFLEEKNIPKTHICRISSLSPRVTDTVKIFRSLAELYVAGVDIDWNSFNKPFGYLKKVALPNYPFQRERYWIERALHSTTKKSELEGKVSAEPKKIEQKPEQKLENKREINGIEEVMIQQIETMSQLMKRHLELLKKIESKN